MMGSSEVFRRVDGKLLAGGRVVAQGRMEQPHGVEDVAMTQPTCRWILAAGTDGTVRRYELHAVVSGQPASESSPAALRGRVGLCAEWSTLTPLEAALTSAHIATGRMDAVSPSVYSIAAHGQGLWCLTGEADGRVRLWTLRGGAKGTDHHVMPAHSVRICIRRSCRRVPL